MTDFFARLFEGRSSNSQTPAVFAGGYGAAAGLAMLCLLLMAPPLQAQVDDETRVLISFELPYQESRGRYREPFVAIWLETAEGKPRSSIKVLYNRARWLPDLSDWWEVLGFKATHRLDAMSGATRGPGSFVVEWDGLDSADRELEAGDWLLAIEVARQHGGRESLRVPIQLHMGEFSAEANGSGEELGRVKVLVLENDGTESP